MTTKTDQKELKFDVKWNGDTLLGLIDGDYQVTIITKDNSQIELADGENTLVKATVRKAIFDTNDNLDYLAVEDLHEYTQGDASSDISTTELSMIFDSDQSDDKILRHTPPSKQKQPQVSKGNNEQMGRCSSCGKIVNTDSLTDGVCMICKG